MRVFTPFSNIAYPVARSEYMAHRVLRPHEAYLIDDTIAYMIEQLAAMGQGSGRFDGVIPRPLDVGTKRLLILCPGGIGDLVCIKACLKELHKWYPSLEQVGFVSSGADRQIFLDGVDYGFDLAVLEYPVTLRQANYYGAWVAFGSQERQSLRKDIIVSFSEQLGMQPPAAPARLIPNPIVRNYLKAHIGSNRKRIGVQIHAAAHYRSWHTGAAFITMSGLVERGYDCYVLGSSKQRIVFRDDEGTDRLVWDDGIYDMSGILTSAEEMIAFASLMDVIIAPDSGFLHIGGTLKKPTIGLFGLSDASSRHRYYPTLTSLQGRAECAPCWCIAETPSCGNSQCLAMMDIGPELIVETVERVMEANVE